MNPERPEVVVLAVSYGSRFGIRHLARLLDGACFLSHCAATQYTSINMQQSERAEIRSLL